MPFPNAFYYTDVKNSQQKKKLIINDWRGSTDALHQALGKLLEEGFEVSGYQGKKLVAITNDNINTIAFNYSNDKLPKEQEANTLVVDFYWINVLTSGIEYNPEHPWDCVIDFAEITESLGQDVASALQYLSKKVPIIVVNDTLRYEKQELPEETELRQALNEFSVTTHYSHAELTTKDVKKLLGMKNKPNLQELISLEIERIPESTLTNIELENIIASSPKLQKLTTTYQDFRKFNYQLLSPIKYLSITQSRIRDFKKFVAHTSQLTNLSLHNCSFEIDDSIDVQFSKLESLTLTVSEDAFNQKKLEQLLRISPNLKNLTLDAPGRFTLPGRKFEHLETLALTSISFSLDNLDNSSFGNLHTLRLSNMELTANELSTLSEKAPKLNKLKLDNCWLHMEMPTLNNIEELVLNFDNEEIGDAEINSNFLQNLGTSAPQLKKLSISFNKITTWQPVKELQQLEELTLSCACGKRKKIEAGSQEEANLLSLLKSMPKLRKVNLERFCQIPKSSPVYQYLYENLQANAIKIKQPVDASVLFSYGSTSSTAPKGAPISAPREGQTTHSNDQTQATHEPAKINFLTAFFSWFISLLCCCGAKDVQEETRHLTPNS